MPDPNELIDNLILTCAALAAELRKSFRALRRTSLTCADLAAAAEAGKAIASLAGAASQLRRDAALLRPTIDADPQHAAHEGAPTNLRDFTEIERAAERLVKADRANAAPHLAEIDRVVGDLVATAQYDPRTGAGSVQAGVGTLRIIGDHAATVRSLLRYPRRAE